MVAMDQGGSVWLAQDPGLVVMTRRLIRRRVHGLGVESSMFQISESRDMVLSEKHA